MSKLELREWSYCQRPQDFDMDSCDCGNHVTQWSEYKNHLWCVKCEKDFIPKFNGIFEGPIPMELAYLMGVSFDRINLKTWRIERFDRARNVYLAEDGTIAEEFADGKATNSVGAESTAKSDNSADAEAPVEPTGYRLIRAKQLLEWKGDLECLDVGATDTARDIDELLRMPAPIFDASEKDVLREVWLAAGGNPGMHPDKQTVLKTLQFMDAACNQADLKTTVFRMPTDMTATEVRLATAIRKAAEVGGLCSPDEDMTFAKLL